MFAIDGTFKEEKERSRVIRSYALACLLTLSCGVPVGQTASLARASGFTFRFVFILKLPYLIWLTSLE